MILDLFLLSTLVSVSSLSFESSGMKLSRELVYQANDSLWGFDFIDENQIIFTERSGKMKILKQNGAKSSSPLLVVDLNGLPKVVTGGQGGLLDLKVLRNGSDQFKIYFCYTSPRHRGTSTQLSVAEIAGNQLTHHKVLFTAEPEFQSVLHFGCRIVFDDKNHLFLSVGERNQRDFAQDLSSHLGKIIRLSIDGQVPKDNPSFKSPGAKPEIWSYGHRNPQGLFYDSKRRELWETEHGPRGGDELNRIRKGLNYGWPVITFGKEYYGPSIGEGTSKPGMENAVDIYVPSIAPSGLVRVLSEEYPGWKDDFLLGALAHHLIMRVRVQNEKVLLREKLLEDQNERVRNIQLSPKGIIYYSTDTGALYRILNQSKR